MPSQNRPRNTQRKPMEVRQTTVCLTPEDDELLTAQADKMGVTRSAVVRLALRSWALDGSDSAPSQRTSGSTSRGGGNG